MKRLHGIVKIDEIEIGDEFPLEGKVEKIRETKTLRILTVYGGYAQRRREMRFRKGRQIFVP
jgi:hypothetical protein